MLVNISEEDLPFFEALASPVRIRIIQRLACGDANIKELAEHIGVSSAIMTQHVKKLRAVGLIQTRKTTKAGKICMLIQKAYELGMPRATPGTQYQKKISISVGQYTDAQVETTCGLANETRIIGDLDDPRYFFDVERIGAQLIWFSAGYVEYTISNYVERIKQIESVEISAELGSEFPHFNNDWKSDIRVYLNGELLCEWTSPGDFGDRQGLNTPSWWASNQYGLLKHFKVTEEGVFLDGELKTTERTLNDFHLELPYWRIRFESPKDCKYPGGLSLFGQKFGDYNQDIVVTINHNC